MQKLEVTGITCASCSVLINLVIEDWEGVELTEEAGKHYLIVPEQWQESISLIADAVKNANPAHNYQVHI